MAIRIFQERRIVANLLLVCAFLAPGLGYWAWRAASVPHPPLIESSHVEKPVARAIEAAVLQVRKTPRSAIAWGHLGMVYLAHGFADQARTCFAEAEKLDRRDPRWPYLQGTITSGNADPDSVIPPLQRAVERSGREPVPRLRLGEILIEQNRLGDAESQFRAVLDIDPANARAHLGMGRVLRARGELQQSVAYLRRSVATAPKTRTTHALLAELYYRLGDQEAARNERRLASTLSQSVLWPDPYLAEVLYREVGSVVLLHRAESFIENRLYDQALALLRKMVEIHPESAPAHLQLWRVLTVRQAYAEADQALREGVRLAPDSVQALYYQGVHQARLRRFEGAVDFFRKVTELQPQFAAAYCDLGEALNSLGDRTAALNAFRDAVRYKPDLARGHQDLGLLLSEMGQSADALTHLEQAHELGALTGRAMALLEQLRQKATRSVRS